MNLSSPKLFDDPKPRVQVLIPTGLDQAFDYSLPEGMNVKRGQFVEVSFRNRNKIGVIWGLDRTETVSNVKQITRVLDCPPLPDISLKFIEWMARYTVTPLGLCLKLALSEERALHPAQPIALYSLRNRNDVKQTPQRAKVLSVLESFSPLSLEELLEKSQVSQGVIKAMVERGILGISHAPPPPPFQKIIDSPPRVDLTAAQLDSVSVLKQKIKGGGFSCTLLDGVTGSGKTEVYFEAIATQMRRGGQVLVLLPEIALSTAFIRRFKDRFGVEPALWHSDLTPALREKTYRAVLDGSAPVTVGARSALFLPFPDLRMIIVDEEHDHSFKQEDQVIYQGRDMGVMRARMGDIPVILASATPSLESMVNAWNGKYDHLVLPTRATGALEPDIKVVDMRAQKLPSGQWISKPLHDAITDTLSKRKQALIFMNRRGYAPLSLCKSCGHRIACPNCSANLVEHQKLRKLQCHQCGYSAPKPVSCPKCSASESLIPLGTGVERIEAEIKEKFPDASTLVLSSDTLTTPKMTERALERIYENRINIIIGTQIIGKGHHFPHLHLIGVVDADISLQGSDLRAGERTYQMLHQVSGRAGREAGLRGQVLLQTHDPEHLVIQALASYDRDQFYKTESTAREGAGWPPFGRLGALIISSPRESDALEAARTIIKTAPAPSDHFKVYGPAPAPFARLRGRYRYRILIKASKNIDLAGVLKPWLSPLKFPTAVRVSIDIDPYSFF